MKEELLFNKLSLHPTQVLSFFLILRSSTTILSAQAPLHHDELHSFMHKPHHGCVKRTLVRTPLVKAHDGPGLRELVGHDLLQQLQPLRVPGKEGSHKCSGVSHLEQRGKRQLCLSGERKTQNKKRIRIVLPCLPVLV